MKYKELLKYLKTLNKKQLEQEVQVFRPLNHPGVTELKPVVCIDTIENLELDKARSSVDNKFHGEEIVIMYDHNPFGEDGATLYQMEIDKKSGKLKNPKFKPIYALGKTNPLEQTNPKQVKDLPKSEKILIKKRTKDVN